ncbi:PTS sugar transporter subunit IIA [Fictibacillus sp. NPDC058756]|uniref:PTS sugar transporter subunit IIA n=1 Tax=Fictibacillus sp. NPDC058756 TaxID=3346625 RepID=UPI0036A88D7F
MITEKQIMLSCSACSKEDAIRLVGQRMIELGFVTAEYVNEMLEREKICSTYIANGIAIPHGLNNRSASILKEGMVIAQFPEGVYYDSERAYLLFSIAGCGERHLKILSAVADFIENNEVNQKLRTVSSLTPFYRMIEYFEARAL